MFVLFFEPLHGGLEFFLRAEQLLFDPDQHEAHDDGRDDRGHKQLDAENLIARLGAIVNQPTANQADHAGEEYYEKVRPMNFFSFASNSALSDMQASRRSTQLSQEEGLPQIAGRAMRNLGDHGAVGGTRTRDRRFRKPMLYPVELPPQRVDHQRSVNI